MNQMALGDVLAIEAIQRTAAKNTEFVDRAIDEILFLSHHECVQFTSEDVWARMVETPTDPRAMGAAFRRLQQEGLIRPAGWAKCTRASRHGAPIRVWEAVRN